MRFMLAMNKAPAKLVVGVWATNRHFGWGHPWGQGDARTEKCPIRVWLALEILFWSWRLELGKGFGPEVRVK